MYARDKATKLVSSSFSKLARNRYARALSCFCLLIGSAAEVAAEPSAAERETARSAMDEGDRLRAAGELAPALVHYKAAHAIMHVPTTGIEVARTQAALSQLVEARASALDTANLPPAAAEPAVFASARKAASQLAAELEPRIPAITTVVDPAVEYTLTIDDVQLPATARTLPFRTNPGPHTVTVAAPGYARVVEQVHLIEAERRSVRVMLLHAPATPEPRRVTSSPPGPQPTPAAPPSRNRRPPLTDADESAIHAGQLRGYIALGLGGAVLGAGIVSGIVSLDQTDALERQCTPGGCPASSADRLSTANTLANLANIGIPLGLLAVGYGLYELLAAQQRARAATKPTPALGALTAGRWQLQVSSQGAYAGWAGVL
ncbi:MAG: hypothetical protein ABW321_12525 [Polyangiales bacterium]